MNGYGSHTYQWINAEGERFWVQYHFLTQQGVEPMFADEAERLAGQDADHYRRDLYESIENGEFPSWDVYVQVMPYDEAKDYRFNPFDLTKIWSKKDYPRIKVGTFTLNRNPQNFFAEIEQAAFSPGNQVPGTGISPDKMLMARVFSYPDAQRYRIGTNYNQLPVNQPHAAHTSNYMHEGNMQYHYNTAEHRVYTPNSYGVAGGPQADPQRGVEASWESDGALIRSAATLHSEDDDFGQARTLINDVFTAEERQRFIETLAGQYDALTVPAIQERFFWYWGQVDPKVAEDVRAAVATGAANDEEPVGVGE
jgi:catalase